MAKITWKGDKVTAQVQIEKKKALYKAASHILNESNNIAPKDEGTLILTSGVDPSFDEATVYYAQKYAPRLHEHPEYNFQNGREGKFLEKPLLSEQDKVIKFMQNELKNAFK